MKLQESISPVKSEDFPRVVDVWEASVRETHHFLTEDDIAFFKPLVRDKYLYMVELVCIRDGENSVAGFAGVAEAKLEMLFVHPDWRGKGIGRRLLEHTVREMGARVVDVNEQNEQAVGFYLQMGARVIGRSERDGMGKPFPLLHMRLPSEADETLS